MTIRPVSFLRTVAATLMCVSGLGQIAALWLRELTGTAIADGLSGAMYLVIAIGLFGRSHFSLYLGIVIPAAAIGVILYTAPQPQNMYTLHILFDAAVVLFSALELWRVRHLPSE